MSVDGLLVQNLKPAKPILLKAQYTQTQINISIFRKDKNECYNEIISMLNVSYRKKVTIVPVFVQKVFV
jgi:hypothetical protein